MINSNYEPDVYTGNGVATTFAYGFPVTEATQIKVTLFPIATEVEVVLVLDSDYSLSGVGEDAGGNVTYPLSGPAMANTHKLIIERVTTPLQTTDFEEQGGFHASTHENAFDKVTATLQEHAEQIARSPKVTVESGESGDDIIVEITAARAAAQAAQAAAEAAQTAAQTAETAAETAQSAAETAETAAELAETNSEAAQTAAAASAVTAAASETAAQTAEANAETAEANAETAKAAAETAEANAETAEANAETAQSAAAASETAAAGSATAAAASTTAAQTAETNAETAEANAETAQAAAEAALAAMPTLASQAEAEAGTDNVKYLSALRTAQAIAALSPVTLAGAQTLTNKRITSRIGTTASSATPTPDGDAHDQYNVTALAAGATFGAPTGTPTNGQKLILRILDNGTSRTLAYNAIYRAIGVTLPVATVISKTIYIGLIYNAADTKWDAVAVASEA